MSTKRRLSTDDLVAQLLEEIRADREQAKADRKADREAAEKLQRAITDRLDELGRALANLCGDFEKFRDHVFRNVDQLGKDIRKVSDYVGMTNPPEKNGGR